MKIKSSIICAVVGAMILNGCYSDAEISSAKKVITALPEEVAGCAFLGNVDEGARATIAQARFGLQLQASAMGATHLVETFAYPGVLNPRLLGVALSGRAYKCPLGKGPKTVNEQALLHYDIPSASAYLDDEDGLFNHG